MLRDVIEKKATKPDLKLELEALLIMTIREGHKNKNPRSCVDFIVFVMRVRFSKTPQDNTSYLDVEQKVHHVAIFNDVLFAF